MKKAAFLGITLAILLYFPVMSRWPQLADSAWPAYQHDAQHTGWSDYPGPQTKESARIYDVSRGGGIAVGSDGTLYFGTKNGLYAITPDGNLKPSWPYPIDWAVSYCPLLGSNDTVYAASRTGNKMLAVSSDCVPEWELDISTENGTPLTMSEDGTIYYASSCLFSNSQHPALFSINSSDGSISWIYDLADDMRHLPPFIGVSFERSGPADDRIPGPTSAPSVGLDGTIYVGFAQTLFAINPDGTRKWTKVFDVVKPSNCDIGDASIDSDGTAYLVIKSTYEWSGISDHGYGSSLYALEPNGGEKWKLDNTWSEFLLLDPSRGTLYAIRQYYTGSHIAGDIIAVDRSGNAAEIGPITRATNPMGLGTVNGFLYYISGSRTVIAMDSETGDWKWNWSSGNTVCGLPALGTDGILYVPTFSGYYGASSIYAVGLHQPDISPSTQDYDFGKIPIGEYADWWALVISNDGNALLTVDSVTIDDSAFTIASPSFPQDLPPGDSLNVTVRFSPPSGGPYSSTVAVASNDPDEQEVYVSVEGTGLVPVENLNVPYIHQCCDTHNEFDGRMACGATSAVMILARYGKLPQETITCNWPIPHTSDYGWYVSEEYSLYGHTYDEYHPTLTGTAAGAYGYIHDYVDGDPGYAYPTHTRSYFQRHDLFSEVIYNPIEDDVKAEIDRGHPVWASTNLWRDKQGDKKGHIVVIKGYTDDRFIVHDPWRYEPQGQWEDWRGKNTLYTWDEMEVQEKYIVTAFPDEAPICVVKLRERDTESLINEVNVGESFDIYVGDSTDGIGIEEVRFSSDDTQDGDPTGTWTEWHDWNVSSEDWNATARTKAWSFDASGEKEVWAEIKDSGDNVSRSNASVFAHPGYAVIAAGEGGWVSKRAADHCANNTYRALRNLGFDDSHIFYLNSERPQNVDEDGADEVDAVASVDLFRATIDYIGDRIGGDPVPVILCLEGHGERDVFDFDPDAQNVADTTLGSYQFKEMLEGKFQTSQMLITIGSCYSGSFITADVTTGDSISANNRIIITSTHNDKERSALGWARDSDRFWGDLMKGFSVRDAFVRRELPGAVWNLWLDDNGDARGHPPNELGSDGNLAASTKIGMPGSDDLELTPWILFVKRSPGEIRVCDSQGRITGLVDGKVKEEIPNSIYDEENETIVIFDPVDSYYCEVVGTDEGSYTLDITSIENGEATTFTATDIPTTTGAVHQYTIDWDALSQGEKGVTLMVDSDGDGTFEQTVTADSTLAPPVAEVGGDHTIIVSESVQFDGSNSHDPDGTIVSYQWDFGDANTGAGGTVSHVYATAGKFTVTLTVTDDDNATGTDTTTVTVLTPAQAIDELIVLIEAMNLQKGIDNSFDAKLKAARHSLLAANAGLRNDPINKLEAFINAVEAQRGKQLTIEQADELVNYADRIISALSATAAPALAEVIPSEPLLAQNYPNPFNPDTWIPYQLAEDVDVTIRIYNASGQLVRILDLGHKPAGFYTTKEKAAYWDGRNERGEEVTSGVYFIVMKAGEFTATRKMLMLK